MKAVSDQSTLTALKSALHDILQDDGTKEAVKGLLRDVFSQDEIIAFTSEFIKEVIKSESVLNQATYLGKFLLFQYDTPLRFALFFTVAFT